MLKGVSGCRGCGIDGVAIQYSFAAVLVTKLEPLFLTAYSLVSALGPGTAETMRGVRAGVSGLRRNDFVSGLDTWIGRVPGVEAVALPEGLRRFHCRNNQLAQLGLEQDGFTATVAEARDRYGSHRIGVFLGTSSSGINAAEHAYARRSSDGRLADEFSFRHTQGVYSVVDFSRRYLGLTGPAHSISTACSSSAKVFASAHRQIVSGLCDAAVVGGVIGFRL